MCVTIFDYRQMETHNMMRSLVQATAVAGLLFVAAPVAVNAAPLTTAPQMNTSDGGAVQNVHWRSWRHCHWRHGERWCHGGGGNRYYGYGGGPGIYLNFGHRRHHGHWRHRRFH
jgi:hypothetical protein